MRPIDCYLAQVQEAPALAAVMSGRADSAKAASASLAALIARIDSAAQTEILHFSAPAAPSHASRKVQHPYQEAKKEIGLLVPPIQQPQQKDSSLLAGLSMAVKTAGR